MKLDGIKVKSVNNIAITNIKMPLGIFVEAFETKEYEYPVVLLVWDATEFVGMYGYGKFRGTDRGDLANALMDLAGDPKAYEYWTPLETGEGPGVCPGWVNYGITPFCGIAANGSIAVNMDVIGKAGRFALNITE